MNCQPQESNNSLMKKIHDQIQKIYRNHESKELNEVVEEENVFCSYDRLSHLLKYKKLIDETKNAIQFLEKVETSTMPKVQKIIFESVQEAAFDFYQEILDLYFDLNKTNQNISPNLQILQHDPSLCKFFSKFIQKYREFQNFDQLYSNLSHQNNQEFNNYLREKGLQDTVISCLKDNGIGFTLFLQLDSKILKEDLQLTLRERLIVKSILEQFGK